MAFLDKLFRWKKKPFGDDKQQDGSAKKAVKGEVKEVTQRGTGRYAHIIVRPHISEKAAQGEAQGQYVFEVTPGATKHEVALAVADLYGVRPKTVRMIALAGKKLRFGRTEGTTKHWKKAIVQLPAGKRLEIYKK